MSYPLEQLYTIKKKRLEEAEKVLRDKKIALQKEIDDLKKAEDARNATKKHREEKLHQLRMKMDEGEKTDKLGMMKTYLKGVDQELEKKEKKVKEHVAKVEAAEKAVEDARKVMIQKQHDVEKLKEHKKEWQKEHKIEEERKEGIVTDELGTSMHIRKKDE